MPEKNANELDSEDERERFGRIVQMHANHRAEINEVDAGDIAAAALDFMQRKKRFVTRIIRSRKEIDESFFLQCEVDAGLRHLIVLLRDAAVDSCIGDSYGRILGNLCIHEMQTVDSTITVAAI